MSRLVLLSLLVASSMTAVRAEQQSWSGWFAGKAKTACSRLTADKVESISEKAARLLPKGKEVFEMIAATATVVKNNQAVLQSVQNLVQGNFVGAALHAGQAAYDAYNATIVSLEDVKIAKETLKNSADQIDSKSGVVPKHAVNKVAAAKEVLQLYCTQQSQHKLVQSVENVFGYGQKAHSGFDNMEPSFANH